MTHLSKTYHIRSYECNKAGFLRIRTLFNLFQDMADIHAEKFGFGASFCAQNNLAWVGSAYHVKIQNRPRWNDEVILETWPSGKSYVTAMRDFDLRSTTGDPLIAATSQWVLLNRENMRPTAIQKYLPEIPCDAEHVMNSDFKKIPTVTQPQYTCSFAVRQDDIDLNQHVNNAVYPVWAMEVFPASFHETHRLTELEIQFKKPSFFGETISVSAELNDEQNALVTISGPDGDRALVRLQFEKIK